MVFLFVVTTYAWTDAFTRLGVNPGLVPILALGLACWPRARSSTASGWAGRS